MIGELLTFLLHCWLAANGAYIRWLLSVSLFLQFLPRDAMHNHGYATMWYLSVSLSCLCILSKRINIFPNFFHRRVATPFRFFHTKRYDNIPSRTPPNGGIKCRWGRQKHDSWWISGYWIDDWWWSAINNRPSAVQEFMAVSNDIRLPHRLPHAIGVSTTIIIYAWLEHCEQTLLRQAKTFELPVSQTGTERFRRLFVPYSLTNYQ